MVEQFIREANGKRVGLVLDETGIKGKGLDSFFNQISPFRGRISVWSASAEKVGCPSYLSSPDPNNPDPDKKCYKLTMPYRCPPSIQSALHLIEPYLDGNNICFYEKEAVLSLRQVDAVFSPNQTCQYPAKGLDVKLINHGKHEMPHEEVWECSECGEELADFLTDTLHVGQSPCSCPEKPVCFEATPPQTHCPDCKGLTKGHLPPNECPLMCAEVIIAPTKEAFINMTTYGDFTMVLKSRGFNVSVMTSLAEGDDPKQADDVLYIANITSVFGMERAVIIIIPEASSEEEMEISAPADDQPDTSTQVPTSSADQDASTASHDASTVASSTSVCSKDQFEAALKSLSEQSRKDVFYIASRATYQFVLIHH